jgi:hypothetical protein
MLSQEYFTHYPSRLLWSGGGVLAAFTAISVFLLGPIFDQPTFPLAPRKALSSTRAAAAFSLDLANRDKKLIWQFPSLEDEILVSLSLPRPGSDRSGSLAHIRLKSAQQSMRLTLPCRIYMHFDDRGVLNFQQEEGPFWVNLKLDANGMVVVQPVIEGQVETQASFLRRLDAAVLQKSDEFPSGSPLRILGEAKWNGPDLIAALDSMEEKQRIEIDSNAIEMGKNDWIGWKDGHWVKIADSGELKNLMIAKIYNVSSQVLEWDVWDSDHFRLATPLQSIAPVHVKVEEWINSIRIRSEQQMSCSIEKQSVVLRVGDWVMKENGRWRVLRKAEDRQQVLSGSKNGEMFVLDKIDFKQKSIKGKLFVANRSQMIPIETNAVTAKRDKKIVPCNRSQKGKAS